MLVFKLAHLSALVAAVFFLGAVQTKYAGECRACGSDCNPNNAVLIENKIDKGPVATEVYSSKSNSQMTWTVEVARSPTGLKTKLQSLMNPRPGLALRQYFRLVSSTGDIKLYYLNEGDFCYFDVFGSNLNAGTYWSTIEIYRFHK